VKPKRRSQRKPTGSINLARKTIRRETGKATRKVPIRET